MTTSAETRTLITQEDVDADVAFVRVLQGPDAGHRHAFASSRITIGSGDRVDLVLRDRTASKTHCELVREGGQIRLRDLGSKNGCWIGGCRVDEALLSPDATVRIGTTILTTEVRRARISQAAWRGGEQLCDLVGASTAMQTLFTQIVRVAERPLTVRIRGESGTGKELVARAIHDLSDRRGKPFVVLDAAGLSQQLADLELFGHERGAFTGADRARMGAFERAHGGTLFLDELAELPAEVQPKLLRALEDRTVQRIGGSARIPVDVRVICATHRPLEVLVNQRALREDLFFRLGDVEIVVPPLRERGADVTLVARHLLGQFGATDPRAFEWLERELEARRGYVWPGNVRELRSLVRRVAALGDASSLFAAPEQVDTASRVRMDLPLVAARDEWVAAFERQYLLQLLDETGGNVLAAAERAGVSQGWLYKKLHRHGISWRR